MVVGVVPFFRTNQTYDWKNYEIKTLPNESDYINEVITAAKNTPSDWIDVICQEWIEKLKEVNKTNSSSTTKTKVETLQKYVAQAYAAIKQGKSPTPDGLKSGLYQKQEIAPKAPATMTLEKFMQECGFTWSNTTWNVGNDYTWTTAAVKKLNDVLGFPCHATLVSRDIQIKTKNVQKSNLKDLMLTLHVTLDMKHSGAYDPGNVRFWLFSGNQQKVEWTGPHQKVNKDKIVEIAQAMYKEIQAKCNQLSL